MSASSPSDSSVCLWDEQRAAPVSLFRWTHGFINRLVTLADVTVLLASGLVYPALDHGSAVPMTMAQGLLLATIQAVVFVSVLRGVSAYRVEHYSRLGIALPGVGLGLVASWAAAAGFVAVFAPALLGQNPSLLLYPLLQLGLLVGLRLGAAALVGRIDRLALMRRNTLVIGHGAEAEAAVQQMTDPAEARRFNVVGIVSDEDQAPLGLFAGRPLLGGLAALATIPECNRIDLVVIATPLARSARLPHIIDALQWLSADVVLRLDAATAQAARRPLPSIAGQSVLPLMHRPLKGSQSVMKLIEDRVIATIALAITAPLLLIIALAIRLDSPGPALFRQERVGLHNRTFRIYKFRTMTVDPTDDGARGTTSRHNPRITRVGRVLRSLSLDELPQLLNVLRGDMSIVGPRPYVRNMLVEDQTFQSTVRSFAARHRMKPGITGLAQANGFRSNALRNKRNAEISVQLDMDYIANWSLWLDVRIMVRTITRAMSGPEVF